MKKTISIVLFVTFMSCLHSVFGGQMQPLSIHSKKMDRTIPTTVLLPDSYAEGSRRYAVVYLLHGAGGTHQSWGQVANNLKLADQYEVIIVCPDAAPKSWYFDSPIDPSFQFETFVAKECVEYIDRTYRTEADRTHRALCGNSMGGHGALFLAIRHRNTFATAVALSGGVDIRPFPKNWNIKERIGSIETHPANWENYTVINLAKTLKDGELAISLDCGVGDFFLEVNRSLHNQLIADGIAHHYEENPGKHTWDYWNKAIQRQMPFITAQFNQQ